MRGTLMRGTLMRETLMRETLMRGMGTGLRDVLRRVRAICA